MVIEPFLSHRPKDNGGDTGSYHSSEDSSDEEIHYREEFDDSEFRAGVGSGVGG